MLHLITSNVKMSTNHRMFHQSLLVRNDYERKINYGWPYFYENMDWRQTDAKYFTITPLTTHILQKTGASTEPTE